MNVQCRVDLMQRYEDIEVAVSELGLNDGDDYPVEIHELIANWIGDLAIELQKDELRNRSYGYVRRR